MEKTAIIGGARTPFGRFGGVLQPLPASSLGGEAIKGALERAGIEGKEVEEVLMGNVLQGGQGQLPSRQAARYAGLPWETETETINKVCASGMRSLTLGDQMIRAGDKSIVISGGMESMSNAPYFSDTARWGARMGNTALKDMMVHDGLTCSFRDVHMGVYGGEVADSYGIARERQDEWALRSHVRAAAAIDNGWLTEEIIGVAVPQKKQEPLMVLDDEAPRRNTTLEGLRGLPPIFSKSGTITAGNAPGVNDGACAMVLMSGKEAEARKAQPLAWIEAHTALAVEAELFPKTPGLVIQKLLQKTGYKPDDIDLFEINEAFAAVALVSSDIAGLDENKININGGAVALGHPIGASGARIILTLAHALKRRGGGLGIAAICSGGGQGDAVLIRVD